VAEALVQQCVRQRLDDLSLARACAAGDEGAWAELVAVHGDFLHRFARRVLREPAAGDVADQVIADLWLRRKIARYEGRSSLRTWLGTIVAHAASNARRSARRRERSAAAAGLMVASGARVDRERERAVDVAALIASAIARQSVDDRLLILLYYHEGITLDDIGRTMRRSKAALSRRLKRIRNAILNDADREARRRVGVSAQSLLAGVPLSDINLDLRSACGLPAAAASARSHQWLKSA
jgi:RNA polymerase sigma factor (sigma-70 family)